MYFKKSVKIKSQGQRLKIRIQTKDWEQPWYPDLLGSWRQSCRRQWTFLHQGRSTSLKSPQSENVKMLEWECERQSCDGNLSFILILRLVNVECDLATAIPGARWTFNSQKFFPHLETFYNFYQTSNMDFGQCPMDIPISLIISDLLQLTAFSTMKTGLIGFHCCTTCTRVQGCSSKENLWKCQGP